MLEQGDAAGDRPQAVLEIWCRAGDGHVLTVHVFWSPGKERPTIKSQVDNLKKSKEFINRKKSTITRPAVRQAGKGKGFKPLEHKADYSSQQHK